MNIGDIVRVRLREAADQIRIGIVISPPKKMYMVGNVAQVMIDGKIKHVKEEHIQNVSRGE